MRYRKEDCKPVSPSITYRAERKRKRKRLSRKQVARQIGVCRNVWYRAMAGARATAETRRLFKAWVEKP